MRNRIEIYSDGINAYAHIKVNASKTGIRILSLLLIIEIFLFVILFSHIGLDEIIEMIIPFLIIMVFFVGLPIKYLLWNLYGNEQLIVNTKCISWSYDYGFFKTNLKTIKFDRLGTGYEKVMENDKGEVGKLILYNYSRENNLPQPIHQTTVLLNKDEITEFDIQIRNVFENDFFDKNGFIPFSLN